MATTNGWGLVGTGRIADDRILPGINAFAGNKLIGVCSRDQARAQTFAAKFGARHAYTSYDEMLRNPEVTVVAIHTPNSQHADQAVAAARAGKHVFCDKPMATTVADAERIVRDLFARYFAEPGAMAEAWHAASGGLDEHARARLIADFVAGMTDRFALREHERLTGQRLLD